MAAVQMIKRRHIIGIAIQNVFLVIADGLAIRTCENLGCSIPAEIDTCGVGKIDGREIGDAILDDSLVLHFLAVNGDIINLADISRFSI